MRKHSQLYVESIYSVPHAGPAECYTPLLTRGVRGADRPVTVTQGRITTQGRQPGPLKDPLPCIAPPPEALLAVSISPDAHTRFERLRPLPQPAHVRCHVPPGPPTMPWAPHDPSLRPTPR